MVTSATTRTAGATSRYGKRSTRTRRARRAPCARTASGTATEDRADVATSLAVPQHVRHDLAEALSVNLALDQTLDLWTPSVVHFWPVGVPVGEAAPAVLAVERGFVEAVLLEDVVGNERLENGPTTAFVHEQLCLLGLAEERGHLPGLVLLFRGRVDDGALDASGSESALVPLGNRRCRDLLVQDRLLC